MRERLDCAIVRFGDMAAWCMQKEGVFARGRLYLHSLHQPAPEVDDFQALAGLATRLQRFDSCLLAVCENNLVWVRQALLTARPLMRTPLIGVIRNLTAPAISDLYNLGMADFVREPLCVEEIRIRTDRLLGHARTASQSAYAPEPATASRRVQDDVRTYRSVANGQCAVSASAVSASAVSASVLPQAVLLSALPDYQPGQGTQALDAALEAFAVASASYCATSDDSFGAAKGRVVKCFEQAYLHASLAKASGNIALAARSAKKHRRAYWALMRKHNIDAAPYRNALPPDQ